MGTGQTITTSYYHSRKEDLPQEGLHVEALYRTFIFFGQPLPAVVDSLTCSSTQGLRLALSMFLIISTCLELDKFMEM